MKIVLGFSMEVRNREFSCELPVGARFLHFARDPEAPDDMAGSMHMSAWFEVDIDAVMETKWFRIMGTGHEVHPNGRWLATAVSGPFVWHLYSLDEE